MVSLSSGYPLCCLQFATILLFLPECKGNGSFCKPLLANVACVGLRPAGLTMGDTRCWPGSLEPVAEFDHRDSMPQRSRQLADTLLMSSVNSAISGVSDLLQAISGIATSGSSSALSSALSSSGVQSALKSASTGDLLQLSQQALELQQVTGLFAGAEGAQSTADPGTLLLQSLETQAAANQSAKTSANTTTPASTAGTTPAAATQTPAEQEASYLFGTGNSTVSLLG